MPVFHAVQLRCSDSAGSGRHEATAVFPDYIGVINAGLNLFLVIVFSMGVAGVAIATVFSQVISCVLVLGCLFGTDSCYRLQISKL